MLFKDEIVNTMVVLYEMLRDRGEDENHLVQLKNISSKELTTISNTKNIVIDLKECKIPIIFDISPKFKWTELRKSIDEHLKNLDYEVDYIIFVIRAPMNSGDMNKISDCGHNHQVFSITELQFNKTKHFLVPKHELITEEEKIERIVSQYHLKSRNQLPLILKNDPMCKYLYGKPGNLMKIHRINPTSGINIVYRTVV